MLTLNTSVVHCFRQAAKTRTNHPAIVDKDGSLTYGELLEQVQSLAQWLREVGVVRRARVGVHLPKSREEVIATLAIAATRGVFVNLNHQWTLEQVGFVCKDCDVEVLITSARRARELSTSPLAERFRNILVVGKVPAESMMSWQSLPKSRAALEEPLSADLAALLYTSGSTGQPKGVMISHGQLLRGGEIVSSYLGLDKNERVLSVPPLSFDYGLNQLICTILNGASLVLQPVPIASEIARAVVDFEISGLPLVAPSWVQLSRYLEDSGEILDQVRYVTNTGGAIPPQVLASLPRHFPNADLVLMYGLTEAFRSTYLPPALFATKQGAIGRAIPNVEIFVVDEHNGVCGEEEIGELIHRGDLISLGYWGRPEDSNTRIRVNEHLRPILGDEKVLHSGDLVRRDADGILWFVGRVDGMIKTSGHRVSPTEIEQVANQIDAVTAAVAYGVPNDELGQVIHLVLETVGATLEEKDVMGILRQRLPSYMLPRKLVLQALPFERTSSGKIDRQSVIRNS